MEKDFSVNTISILKKGGIGVLATDTLYGIVGSAFIPTTVERLEFVRNRPSNQPSIILLSSVYELKKFSIQITQEIEKILSKYWPGPVSIIFPCFDKKFQYLHKGTESLAFRIPAKPQLRKLLEHTGPILAPSANLQGKPVAQTIQQAREYFGNNVDFYEDSGIITSTLPSTILRFENGKMLLIREGAFPFKNN